jgi:hypothetical protein
LAERGVIAEVVDFPRSVQQHWLDIETSGRESTTPITEKLTAVLPSTFSLEPVACSEQDASSMFAMAQN